MTRKASKPFDETGKKLLKNPNGKENDKRYSWYQVPYGKVCNK